MKMYRLKSSGNFVGTQAEIPKGESYDTVEVPTNPKSDLIKFLNDLVSEKCDKDRDFSAQTIISFMDDGKEKVEQTIESIAQCGLLTLGRYANAIAIRYQEIGNEKSPSRLRGKSGSNKKAKS